MRQDCKDEHHDSWEKKPVFAVLTDKVRKPQGTGIPFIDHGYKIPLITVNDIHAEPEDEKQLDKCRNPDNGYKEEGCPVSYQFPQPFPPQNIQIIPRFR